MKTGQQRKVPAIRVQDCGRTAPCRTRRLHWSLKRRSWRYAAPTARNLSSASGLGLAQRRRSAMPRGDKSKYTDKQERKADHIAESYEERGVPEKEAERRAWATVNKDDGGGKRPGGSGRGKSTGHPAAQKGGEIGGEAAASRSAESRSASAKKAA